jgi:hypothetical protein
LLIASIITLAALYYSQAIMAPVTFALFTVAIAWPLQSALQKRIPVLLALVVTMVVTLAVLAILIFLVVWGFGLVFQWVINNTDRIQTLYAQATEWLDSHGVSITNLVADSYNPGWIIGATGRLAAGATVSYLSSSLPLPSLCSDCWKSISRRVRSQNMIVDGGDFESILNRRCQYWGDFSFKQNQIAHHHRATMDGLECRPAAERECRLYGHAFQRHAQISSRKTVSMNIAGYSRRTSQRVVDFFPIDFLSFSSCAYDDCSRQKNGTPHSQFSFILVSTRD